MRSYVGDADDTVDQICKVLNPHALHFAFLDPYKLDLPFAVMQELAKFERMDMLIHVSAMDFQRNLRRYVEEEPSPLDSFAPGWRGVVDLRERDELVRQKIFGHWLSKIRSLDMRPSQGIELVTGSNNQPLYWLVFVARHPLAGRFWDEIRKVDSQSNMF